MSETDRAWVATRKGLIELRRARGGWAVHRTSFLGEPVTMLLPPDSEGRMLAALNLGHFGVKVHASADAGATWQEVATPLYPPQPAGSEGPAWKLIQVWSLERAGATVWAGTMPGGLFASNDFGQSWTLQRPLWDDPRRAQWMGGGNEAPGMHSLCPHPQDAGDLVVGISCGGAWRTVDGGDHWHLRADGMVADYMPPELAHDGNTQDPHRIVRCAARPEVLWCQHHGGIWRSVDSAARWERLHAPVSSFGFAVAVHPREADTAWFVPAVSDMCRVPVDGALCVNRTRNAGRTWDTLREGLPQRDCYDLVYRHGLDVAADGRSLLMGSTTGGLWSSDDGGDRWNTVSLNLPPIAALRFG